MLMATDGWGCLLPDARASPQTLLPCPSLYTSMSLSLPHLYFEIMARTLLPSLGSKSGVYTPPARVGLRPHPLLVPT